MAKHTLLSWLQKWAAPTGRFRDNSDFEIAEDDYRELSQDIGDTFFQPIDELLTRVDKLENPAPEPVEGVNWVAGKAPKVSVGGVDGTDVIVTDCEGVFDGVVLGKTAGVVHQAPKPQEGTTRVDILAATVGDWVYIYGAEDGITPAFEHPTDPTIKLLFAAYLIWTSAGAVVEEPMVYVRTVDNQAPDPNGNVNTDFSRHAAYTAAPADGDISAWQLADGTKRKLSWSQFKTWLGGGSVDKVNTIAPDAGTKNITLTSAHIDNTVNDATWWGTVSLKIKGALDYLANKLKLLEGRVTTLEAGGGGAGGSITLLGTFGADETAGLHQSFLTSEIRDKRPTYEQVPSLTDAQKAALNTGETYVFTAMKQVDGSVTWGAGVGTLNKFAPDMLDASLVDSNANWNGQRLVLTGDNSGKALGKAGQEKTVGRRWYLCRSSTPTEAVWERNSTVSMLDSANAHDNSIINALLNEAGWQNNNKTLTIKSCKGDEYTADTGYYYTCYSDTNQWRRVGEPKTADMFLTYAMPMQPLIDILMAHDFTASNYSQTSNSYGCRQGQQFYDKVTRKHFVCMEAKSNSVVWERLK